MGCQGGGGEGKGRSTKEYQEKKTVSDGHIVTSRTKKESEGLENGGSAV